MKHCLNLKGTLVEISNTVKTELTSEFGSEPDLGAWSGPNWLGCANWPWSNHNSYTVLLFSPKCTKSPLYTVVQKNWTPTIFSNKFNKYWSTSTIFGRQNLQRVSNVHICS